jgi:hypothetical protein
MKLLANQWGVLPRLPPFGDRLFGLSVASAWGWAKHERMSIFSPIAKIVALMLRPYRILCRGVGATSFETQSDILIRQCNAVQR